MVCWFFTLISQISYVYDTSACRSMQLKMMTPVKRLCCPSWLGFMNIDTRPILLHHDLPFLHYNNFLQMNFMTLQLFSQIFNAYYSFPLPLMNRMNTLVLHAVMWYSILIITGYKLYILLNLQSTSSTCIDLYNTNQHCGDLWRVSNACTTLCDTNISCQALSSTTPTCNLYGSMTVYQGLWKSVQSQSILLMYHCWSFTKHSAKWW